MRIVCQEIRRINNEIIRMKGIEKKFSHLNLMPQNLMGINLIANSLKHCYLASQSNLSMNQILSHLSLAASFSFRFSFLFSFLFCRYVSHGVICLLSFSFNLLVTRSSVVSWRPGSQVISNSWSLSDLCSLSSISFKSSCYHGDKKHHIFQFLVGF